MKKNLFLLILFPIILGCGNSGKENPEPARTGEYRGEFVYTPEAAVLRGNSFIYGVFLNDLASELATQVEAVKEDDSDIVSVTVEGEVTRQPPGSEGWDEIITITKIINVSDSPSKADIQLKEK